MKYSSEIKTGTIVLSGIILLLWGVNYLKGKQFFVKRTVIYAVYNQVDGLADANPVNINGMKVGRVMEVKFLPDNSGKIIVTLVIDNSIRIPKNSIAKIESSDLMGSKTVQVVLGNSTAYVESGDTLQSDLQLSITEEVNKQVAPIKAKAENLLASLDSIMSVLQYAFNQNTRENLAQSFENIGKTVKALERTSFRLDTLISSQQYRVVNIFSNIESITGNLKNNNEKITRAIQNFSMISDTIAKSQLAATISNTSKALKDFSAVMEKINHGEGSIGLLLNNDSLYHGLSSTAKDLDLLLKDINENPKKYVQFSVFGKRYKPKKKK